MVMLSSQFSRALGLVMCLFHCNRERFGNELWEGEASAVDLMTSNPVTLSTTESYASAYNEKDKYIEM